jgi:hypothetical protein
MLLTHSLAVSGSCIYGIVLQRQPLLVSMWRIKRQIKGKHNAHMCIVCPNLDAHVDAFLFHWHYCTFGRCGIHCRNQRWLINLASRHTKMDHLSEDSRDLVSIKVTCCSYFWLCVRIDRFSCYGNSLVHEVNAPVLLWGKMEGWAVLCITICFGVCTTNRFAVELESY